MEWQPIETAPKDGRHLLGWFPKGKRDSGGRQIAETYVESIFWNGSEWAWVQDGDVPVHQPTYWAKYNPPEDV